MTHTVRIAPSLLSADFSRLGEEITAVQQAGADLIHVDVMDGHFVPNITFGPNIVKAIRPLTSLPLDVHLMIEPADPFIEAFASAGADIITVHPESGPHLHRTLARIRELGKKAGVALNPATPIDVLEHVIEDIDLVLVMTVNPGFGGQMFIEHQLRKVQALRQWINAIEKDIALEVDGGITPDTAPQAIAAGADILVAGTATFTGGVEHYAQNIQALRGY